MLLTWEPGVVSVLGHIAKFRSRFSTAKLFLRVGLFSCNKGLQEAKAANESRSVFCHILFAV